MNICFVRPPCIFVNILLTNKNMSQMGEFWVGLISIIYIGGSEKTTEANFMV